MSSIDQLETAVMEQAPRPPSLGKHGGQDTKPRVLDPAFAELIEGYRRLVNTRTIPYPVAYELLKELGHGRQGIIFMGLRRGARGCQTRHAIKLFDPGIYSSAEKYWTDMGRIANQVSVLQPVNNRNLVTRDFYDECNGIGYMQMQAIDGVDIDFLLHSKHLELARTRSTDKEWKRFTSILFRIDDDEISFQPGLVIYLLRNVLRGLAALHDKGFVHGDVKPTNIMINIQGSVVIVDFGRAVRIGEHVNILLGSPLYMAPEIHRREPGTGQSDFFSAGLVALETLRGRQIARLSDRREEELLEFKMTLSDNIQQYLPGNVTVNPDFVHVLRRFLQPGQDQRYETAQVAELGHDSLRVLRRRMDEDERETEYEQELELYLKKLIDPETGTLNPHFASDNLTAMIIT